MPIADILSRAYLSDCNGKRGQFPQINGIKHLPATDAYITMQALKKNTEWLTGKQGYISSYFAVRDELAVHDGLLFKGEPDQECSQT